MKEADVKLVLENGMEFPGHTCGAHRSIVGEVVFNTSMVGYQEILSDPSYTNQIVVMTYPLIGNYGITDDDFETKSPTIGGMIMRECCETPSNFRHTKTMSETLEEAAIPAVCGIDTRRLTRVIRDEGCMRAAIVDIATTTEEALRMISDTPVDKKVVAKVSCKKRWFSRTPNQKFNVVAIDCGIKYNIIRSLNARGCNVIIVPFDMDAEQIMAFQPDGIFISNGPGDPEDVPEVQKLVRKLRGRLPIFGICLGHQIISLAFGAKTYKLKFGHRGGNHPVKNMLTGKIEITSQNHNYAVRPESVRGTDLEITHVNLLDGTVEGVRNKEERIFSVQYHPESAPGPQDSGYLFDVFIRDMEEHKKAKEVRNA
ncbi:MAG: glutamine-hydrolyzing carbamoyl-phosphate synthase small subunit [Muribaculaceae bacterium]|nr:glutamine-hydrolyzing carbamoyl-phosphate synthase small subunit [Muribaculaceae bacterium]